MYLLTIPHVQQVKSDTSIHLEMCFCPPDESKCNSHPPFRLNCCMYLSLWLLNVPLFSPDSLQQRLSPVWCSADNGRKHLPAAAGNELDVVEFVGCKTKPQAKSG